jgi:predicted nucleic acid-binding protein
MRYMLDTTFVVDHERQVPAAVARLQEIYENGDDPVVTSVIVSEAWVGARQPDDPDLERFLRYLEYVHPGPETARRAGQFRAEASRRGFTLGLADALIAASAYDLDATVLTRNIRDFELTPVRVETY